MLERDAQLLLEARDIVHCVDFFMVSRNGERVGEDSLTRHPITRAEAMAIRIVRLLIHHPRDSRSIGVIGCLSSTREGMWHCYCSFQQLSSWKREILPLAT